jgi:hypothetical protein
MDFRYRNETSGEVDTDFNANTLKSFIFKSTYVGSGPDMVRELDTQNTIKLFEHEIPALILFYDPEAGEEHTMASKALDYVFGDIQGKVLVLKANIQS